MLDHLALVLALAPWAAPPAQETAPVALAPYEPPGEEITAAVAEQLEGLDPARTGWPSEVLHDLAKPRLADFVESLARGAIRDLGHHLAPDFEGSTPLRPAGLVRAFERDGLRVDRAPAEALRSALEPPGRLAPLAEALLAPYRGGGPLHLHPKAKIYTTVADPSDARRFTTRALVRLDGPLPSGALQATNMEWTLGWERLEGAAVAIRWIRLESFDEVRAPGPLFEEVTEQVLGSIPRYRDELLRGSNEYHFRLDRMDGNVYSGQYGIAVGDLNGDGLDDLVVPMHGGLPNRVLLHEPDGSVRDATDASGLGLLEETQSALIVDLDNDGDQDVALACGPAIVLAYNDGHARFTLRPRPLAVGGDKIESMAAADWDGDGDLDLYACMYNKKGPLGTVPTPYQNATNGPRNVAWRNDGPSTRPRRISEWTDVTSELGFDENNCKFSYGALFEDLDGDGDGRQDLLLRSRTAPTLRVYRNALPRVGRALAVELRGDGVRVNRDAIGATVFARVGDRRLRQSVRAGEGFLAQGPKRLHFGLGDAEAVDELVVRWPDGRTSELTDPAVLAAGGLVRVARTEAGASVERLEPPATERAWRAETLPEDLPGRARRVVLAAELPIGPLRIPTLSNPERRVRDIHSKALLINLWREDCAPCLRELGAFGKRLGELRSAGLELVPLNLGGADARASGDALLERLGLGSCAGGTLDAAATELLLGGIYAEVHPPRDNVPFETPTSFLVDPRGDLLVVYHGELSVDTLLADLAVLGESSERPVLDRLRHGVRLVHGKRDFAALADAIRTLGRTRAEAAPRIAEDARALAAYYDEVDARTTGYILRGGERRPLPTPSPAAPGSR